MEGVFSLKTKRLTEQDIDQAAAILWDGGLLGIPTETVYGLGFRDRDASIGCYALQFHVFHI